MCGSLSNVLYFCTLELLGQLATAPQPPYAVARDLEGRLCSWGLARRRAPNAVGDEN